jgi:hypothetical protein
MNILEAFLNSIQHFVLVHDKRLLNGFVSGAQELKATWIRGTFCHQWFFLVLSAWLSVRGRVLNGIAIPQVAP